MWLHPTDNKFSFKSERCGVHRKTWFSQRGRQGPFTERGTQIPTWAQGHGPREEETEHLGERDGGRRPEREAERRPREAGRGLQATGAPGHREPGSWRSRGGTERWLDRRGEGLPGGLSVHTTQEGWPPRCCSSRKASRSSGLCSRGAFSGPVHLAACSLSLEHTLPPLPSPSRGQRRPRGGTPPPLALGPALPVGTGAARPEPGGLPVGLRCGGAAEPAAGKGGPCWSQGSTAPDGGRAGRAGGTLTPCRDPNPGLCLTQSTVCPGFPSRCTQGQRRRLAEQGDPWKVPRSRGHHARGARGRASPAAGRKVPRGPRARGRALAGPRCSRPAEAPLLTGAEAAGRDPRPRGQQ